MLAASGRGIVATSSSVTRLVTVQQQQHYHHHLRRLPCNLPFRRTQRFRSRREARPYSGIDFFARTYTQSLPSRWPASSPAGPVQGQKQTRSDEEADSKKMTSSSSVRVTDKRSASDVRQAEIIAREAEKANGKTSSERAQQQTTTSPSAQATGGGGGGGGGDGVSAAHTTRETVSGTITTRQQQTSGPSSPSQSSSSSSQPQGQSPPGASAAPSSPNSSELLKQRLQQAQEKLERPIPTYGLGSGGTSVNLDGDGSQIIHQAASPSSSTSSSSTNSSGPSASASTNPSSNASTSGGTSGGASTSSNVHGDRAQVGGMVPTSSVPSMESMEFNPPSTALDHLFDTRLFVKRLEEAGFLNPERLQEATRDIAGHHRDSDERQREVQRWIASFQNPKAVGSQEVESDASEDSHPAPAQGFELSTQPLHRPHDPAEAIMQLTSAAIQSQASQTLDVLLNRVQVENQRYLFTAALSELRTELQVRARNDAAALRSITTLLQREVDSLSQKMKEDIERMKHDIQVDMNNRKGEAKEEQNSLDQEIQDLNNRFTISLSDLKTEIEQSIKWDLTRRALALVFGLASIFVVTLLAADGLSRRADRQKAEEAAALASQAGEVVEDGATVSNHGGGGGGGGGGGLIKRRSKTSPSTTLTSSSPRSPSSGSMSTHLQQQQQPLHHQHHHPLASQQHTLSLRPAEELGLVEQYDQEERFV